jgi:hypothetical protein
LPPEAENLLRYDRYGRLSAMDHFYPRESRPEALRDGSAPDLGDFPGRPFASSIALDRLFLTSTGSVRRGEVRVPVFLQKEIAFEDRSIRMTCTIRNLGAEEIEFLYASEWNFYQTPEEFRPDASGAVLCGGRLRFSFEPAAQFQTHPLTTLSQSEKDFDVIHQGYCLLPAWPLVLSAGASARVSVLLAEDESGG